MKQSVRANLNLHKYPTEYLCLTNNDSIYFHSQLRFFVSIRFSSNSPQFQNFTSLYGQRRDFTAKSLSWRFLQVKHEGRIGRVTLRVVHAAPADLRFLGIGRPRGRTKMSGTWSHRSTTTLDEREANWVILAETSCWQLSFERHTRLSDSPFTLSPGQN